MKGKVIRMSGTLMMVILGLLGGCENGKDAGVPVKQQTPAFDGTIVALGDSLTAGYGVKEKEAYPAQIERRLNESGYRWRVINAGISGETSSETLSRINQVLELKPAIVILEIGVNDGFQGIDAGIIRKNIEETVRILKENKITVVLAGMRMLADMGHDYNAAFAAIYSVIAGENDLILIPFFLEGVAGDPALNKGDGIHPNGKGYRIVTDRLYPYVVKAISSFNFRLQ
jgi:acyl-CoA thioesterase-1